MTKKKTIKDKKGDITLVGAFKGRNIYIVGDIKAAKEYSEYMELGFEALGYINAKFPDKQEPIILDSNNIINGESITKTTRSKKSIRSKS